MLFNSWPFIFIFLPILLFIWRALSGAYPSALAFCLLAASLIFYASWGAYWFLLLLAMISINYALGQTLENASRHRVRQGLLMCGIALNLLPLIWFKYSGFIIQNLALLLGAGWRFIPPVLPVGISFYTFIQIAWLIGIYRNQFQPAGFLRHALFSCAFPYILSGPIVRYDQIGPQLQTLTSPGSGWLARGFTLFGIGLAKKVILADSIGFYADAVFSAAERGWPLACMEAWLGSLCYAFQLYFDFSGYTDMAIGIGLLLGLRLPQNFDSPYKATGIADFWRRWHITLGTWLRDFIYIPLGGNRRGRLVEYRNLFLTMLIGGAWHGAAWTFIIWGGLHGFMLCINHYFRSTLTPDLRSRLARSALGHFFAVLLTFLCLDLCWVIFRAESIDGALAIYQAMFSPDSSVSGGGALAVADIFHFAGVISPNRYLSGWQPFLLLILCAFICWACPNSWRIISGSAGAFAWKPSFGWAVGMALLTFVSLMMLSRGAVFLYFKF